MKDATLYDIIKRREGIENCPYINHREELAIGYGRRLEEKGISDKEAMILLTDDLLEAIESAKKLFPEFKNYSETRKRALIIMLFELGEHGFLSFKRMISAILEERWELAADEAKDSKWYKRETVNGDEIVKMLRNG